MGECIIDNCDKIATRKFMCQTHYKRKKAGKPMNDPINTHNVLRNPIKLNKKEYAIYRSMIDRCTRLSHPEYPRYGGRGITVCERWKLSFDNFIDDMGKKPIDKSIDRIDFNGNYNKDNCRWSNNNIQSYNQRISSSNTTGYKGISKTKDGTYHVYISKNNKRYNLSYVSSLEEAIKIRKEAELKYYPELQ